MPGASPTTGSPWIAGNGAGGPFNETSLPFQNPDTSGLSYIEVSREWEADFPVWETPFEADPKEYLYRLRYLVRASEFQSLARDAAGPYGGYHVGESNFRPQTGGILSFIREFARVPDSRNEFESYVHAAQVINYSGVIGGSGNTIIVSDASITEIPITVMSRLQYDYFHTDNPETIELDKAPRAIVVGTTGYMLHGFGLLVAGEERLAEDAVMRIWKGKIYERFQRFIEVRALEEEV